MHSSLEILKSAAQLFSIYSPLLAITIGIIYYKHLSGGLQFLFFILIYGFINDLLTSKVYHRTDMVWVLNNIYFVFETLAMGIVMVKIEKRVLFRKIIRVVLVLILILWSGSTLYNPEVYLLKFNMFVYPVRAITFSIFTGMLIYDLSGREDYLFRFPAFWVLVGFFIYLFCNIIIFLSISLKLREHTNIINKIWFMHNTLSAISNLIYAYAFYLARKGKYYASSGR